MDEGHPLGQSYVAWEPPDIVSVAFIGDVSGDEMRRILAEGKQILADKPYAFCLADLSRLASMSSEARVAGRDGGLFAQMRGTATFGASFHIRVITMLVTRARNFLWGERDNTIELFASEAEARA
jgi:hypothetical protein